MHLFFNVYIDTWEALGGLHILAMHIQRMGLAEMVGFGIESGETQPWKSKEGFLLCFVEHLMYHSELTDMALKVLLDLVDV